MREAEATTDDPAVPEEFLDLVGMRGRADVEVFRLAGQQQIANAASDEIRGITRLLKPVQDLQGIGVDIRP